MQFQYLDRIIFHKDALVKEVLERFNETAIWTEKSGFAIITDKEGKCIGVVSDGDIRRKLLEDISIDAPVEKILNRDFSFVNDTDSSHKILRQFDKKFVITHEQITEKISPKTKLVCIANPNSPTGTVFTIKDLEKIIQTALNNEALVLVDEAYYQFWGYSAVDLISVYDNLIVTRTFSKALGLASARLGYVLSTNEIISHLFRVRPIYEVNAFAVGFGIYTLEHPDIVIEYITEIRQARKWLEKKLLSDGFNVAKGFANFVLIDVGGRKRSAQITEGLLKEKIIIKGAYQEVCMEPYIRIGLGTLEQMKSFLKKFRKVLREIA